MDENHLNGPTVEEIAYERQWQLERAAVQRAARTGVDWFMDARDWRACGLAAAMPDYSIPPDFHWTIYSIPSKDDPSVTRVGIKFFGAHGCFDIREYSFHDPAIPYSDEEQQALIDEEMGRLARAEHERVRAIREEKIRQSDRERGFPAGEYRLVADFPIKNGTQYRMVVTHQFRVRDEQTAEDVAEWVRGDAVMAGFHNYSLDVLYPKRYAVVHLRLQRPGVPDIPYELKIDATGHLATEEDIRRHRTE